MKIHLLSDLHLEFSDYPIEEGPYADVLVLAGDIMVANILHDRPAPTTSEMANRYRNFLRRCSYKYPSVLYVAGNHEFYHGKWHGTIDWLMEECAKFNNVYMLENNHWTSSGVTFVGATLWVSMRNSPLVAETLRTGMSDFHLVRNEVKGYKKLSPADVAARHQESLAYFDRAIRDAQAPVIVISHHAPTSLSIHERFKGDSLSDAYYTDLSEFILERPKIAYWFHGHTHDATRYHIGSTEVVVNPRGYHNVGGLVEQTGYDANLIIEV